MIMRESDICKEITDTGGKEETFSSSETEVALPSQFASQGELEDLTDYLQRGGVESPYDQENEMKEDDIIEEKKIDDYEKTEDLVRAYFRSLGNIPILTRQEEADLARRIEEGEEILKRIMTKLPFYGKLKATSNCAQEFVNHPDEDKSNEILNKSLEILDNLMCRVRLADEKVKKYGTLQNLKRLIRGKKRRQINPHKLNIIAEEVQKEYKDIESEVGTKIHELKTLYERITTARELIIEARNEFITRNLRLVIKVAKHYIGRGLSFLDLIEEGNIGLIKAMDRFDYKKGFKFSTYATWWIKQSSARAIMDQAKTIRVPIHIIELYNSIARVSREIVLQLGREPSTEEIAERLGISVWRIEDVFETVQDTISLQTLVGDDESTLEEIVGDNNSISPYSNVEQTMLSEQILKVLKTLSPKEEKVIRMRYGIGFSKDYTLEEIGRYFSVTRERIRQIELKAIRKLKHPQRLHVLKALHTASL